MYMNPELADPEIMAVQALLAGRDSPKCLYSRKGNHVQIAIDIDQVGYTKQVAADCPDIGERKNLTPSKRLLNCRHSTHRFAEVSNADQPR